MTEKTSHRQETYRATLREEHVQRMLKILFPTLKPAHEAALVRSSAQALPLTLPLEQLADAPRSTLECVFMPQMHYPTLLVNDCYGKMHCFELRAAEHAGCQGYEIIEMGEDVAHARYDLYLFAQGEEVAA